MAWRVFQRHDEIRDLWASAISKLNDCGGIQKEHTWKVKQDGKEVARIRKVSGKFNIEAGSNSVVGLPGMAQAQSYCDAWL